MENRRKHPRITVSECAVLSVLDGSDVGGRHDVQIVNVSANGVGLFVDVAVEPGVGVLILAANHTIEGTIAYCRPADGVYSAGVEVDESTGKALELQQSAILPPYRRLGAELEPD